MKIKTEILKTICQADEEYFHSLGVYDPAKKLVFIDNGAPVLGIAHLDSVSTLNHFYSFRIGEERFVFSPKLDDRLGVYVLLSLLPSLGVHMDILLTTDEESGRSTGANFTPPRQYNWMFQFDRTGDDVVHYQYNTPKLISRLKKAGFKNPSRGAASDISKMGHLKCLGFNVGTAYLDYHTEWARANLTVLASQTAKFLTFYKHNKDIAMPYDPPTPSYPSRSNFWDEDYYNTRYGSKAICRRCNGEFWSSTASTLCYVCTRREGKEKKKCIDCNAEVEADAVYANVCKKHSSNYRDCAECRKVVATTDLMGEVCSMCRSVCIVCAVKGEGNLCAACSSTYDLCDECSDAFPFSALTLLYLSASEEADLQLCGDCLDKRIAQPEAAG